MGSIPRLGRFPWRKKWLPSPAFLPGESYGQRSLEGYSLWGHRKVRHDWTYIHSFNWQKYLKVKVKLLSRVRLVATPWTVAYQAPPSVGFSRQEYWSGLPFPSPGDLPNPGIEPGSPTLRADTLPSEPPGKLNPKEQHSPGINMLLLSRSVFARGGKEYGWM